LQILEKGILFLGLKNRIVNSITIILIVLTIIEVMFTGWNPVGYPVTSLWITCLMFWVFITPTDYEDVDASTNLLRIIWIITILIFGSILVYYQFRQNISWQFALMNVLTYLSLLILLMGLSFGHGKWFRLPSRKFWVRLLPLLMLVLVVKVLAGMPIGLLTYKFEQEVQEESVYPVEELGIIEFTSYNPLFTSTIIINFFEELSRISTYLAGVTNPILNSALWAAEHDLRASRYSEQIDLATLERPKIWLTINNLSFMCSLIAMGVIFLRVFVWEKSIWSVLILHYSSNILPEIILHIIFS